MVTLFISEDPLLESLSVTCNLSLLSNCTLPSTNPLTAVLTIDIYAPSFALFIQKAIVFVVSLVLVPKVLVNLSLVPDSNLKLRSIVKSSAAPEAPVLILSVKNDIT